MMQSDRVAISRYNTLKTLYDVILQRVNSYCPDMTEWPEVQPRGPETTGNAIEQLCFCFYI